MVSLNLDGANRQRVRDAALPVEMLRANILPGVADGRMPDAVVAQFPVGSAEMIAWVVDRCRKVDELLSVSHAHGKIERYRPSFAANRELVERGVRMLSLFDVAALSDSVAELIIDSPGMPYYFAYGPIPIKVFDRKSVMLEGPVVAGTQSVMVVSRPDVTAAALRYVKTVKEFAVPAQTFATGSVKGLTQRQHAIAKLLSDNLTDEAIAELLGVSVRTVRHDVARLLESLGASTRFSAGLRYAQLGRSPGDP